LGRLLGNRNKNRTNSKNDRKQPNSKKPSRKQGRLSRLNPLKWGLHGKQGPGWGRGNLTKDRFTEPRVPKADRKAAAKQRRADEKQLQRDLRDARKPVRDTPTQRDRKEQPVGKHLMPERRKPNAPFVPTRGGGIGSGRGGSITAAAEQVAAAMAKPGHDIGNLKGMHANLGDIAGSFTALADGLKQAANAQLEAMPDETAVYERLMQLSKQANQVGQEASLIQSDQHRRNAQDHERLDNSRKNERGYDWQSNQQ
jgi:hypothetical protein